MSTTTTVSIRLNAQDLARVDEMRAPGTSRSAFVRELLRQAGPVDEYATHTEALEILTRLARAGKVGAAVALERATRAESAQEPAGGLEEFLRGQ
jgi:hypothetical protein